MKCGLLSFMSEIASNRTCPPRQATATHAFTARGSIDMADAGRHVVTSVGEGIHGTGRQARTVDATVAGARPAGAWRQRQAFGKGEGTAVRMPQAVIRMDQDSEGRRRNRLRPHGPALEWQVGWRTEREEWCGIDFGGDLSQDAPGPTVERMRDSVLRLGRPRKERPQTGADIADQDERTRHGARRQGGYAIVGLRMKAAAQVQAVSGQPGRQRFQVDGQGRSGYFRRGAGSRPVSRRRVDCHAAVMAARRPTASGAMIRSQAPQPFGRAEAPA